MDCIVPGANLKVLSKTVQALSKIGDEVHLEVKPDCLTLRAANMTTTAYAAFKFIEVFFSSYEVDSQADSLSCIIPVKALLGIFKLHGQRDKKPETCKIHLESNPSNIVFKLKYKHDVVVIRSLHLSDGQMVNITYSTDAANRLSANALIFAQVLSNFQLADDDMGIEVSSSKALMRNYITGEVNKSKGIRSQLTLMAAEFNSFAIHQDTCITYSLKPFRAAISFAESFNLGLALNFGKSGRPLVLTIRNPTFEVDFVIATLNSDYESQSTLSTVLKSKRVKKSDLNMTIQDRQALESVNWDKGFSEQENFSEVTDRNQNVNKENNVLDFRNDETNNAETVDDVVPASPESPRRKRIKTVFGRCYDNTFHTTMMDLGEVLAANSDPDSD